MGDYRGVSETQDKSTPTTPEAGHGSSTAMAAPPVKPVIPAAAAKRANASVIGMIVALVVSIAAFLPIVLMNPAPKSDGFHPNIDVTAVARNAAGVAGFTPVTPAAGDTFRPNYARWEAGTGTGVPTWEIGYLTPKEAFIGLVQTRNANPTWLLQQTKNAPVTGTRNAGGQEWELRDTGKGEKSMVLDHRGTTVVLSGEAQLDEFAVLAAAVVNSMDSNPAVTVSPSARPAP
ncbi:DUF4245 domain-containing protein [Arthrobacter sp. KBS0703]|uniref:DUF4245 domain-containing protein n=1 Tax=Arthrobacter sp. KBS0703 TaxID=1955698 RepID=UPI00099030D2|nr:DUF4245 domain-containing protein [Arthrobacter sp. KBS0703]TSE16506.1 DUF4245 domain-containing protein [Arthrobacter sp. KBS0703]